MRPLIDHQGPSWVFSAAHREYLSVRCVPIAASHHARFSVSFRDNRHSDSVNQRPSCAHKRRSDSKAHGRLIALGGQIAGAVIQVLCGTKPLDQRYRTRAG
jgi:hypothetical protein